MSQKITELEIPFYYARKKGQGSIVFRIEADTREQCEEILKSIEIVGESSKYSLLRLDRYPREISCCIVVNNDSDSIE